MMSETNPSSLKSILEAQRAAFQKDGFPDAKTREDSLDRLSRLILENEDAIITTVSEDFNGRSRVLTRAADIVGGAGAVAYTKSEVANWMAPRTIELPEGVALPGTRVEMHTKPVGVVGAIIPWNGPFLLSFIAAMGVLAAGNRLMLKPSELAPRSSALLAKLFAQYFAPEEVAVVEGGAEVAQAFTSLPFDHLLFTGSTRVGKLVMKAAAENLVPVTLELGGKSPVIVGADTNREILVPRLAYGKLMFGGQICVTPDYALVPRGQAQGLARDLIDQAAALYPDATENEDYSAIINDHHFVRLASLVEDARSKGAEVVALDSPADASNSRRFPLHILLNVTEDMDVMQEEIFGPILPIMEYDRIEEALAYIARRPHPLSSYYFGEDEGEKTKVSAALQTGSVVINDVVCQIFHEQIPFGGVGASGMGQYRGYEGFLRFSHSYPVFEQPTDDSILAGQRPPYNDALKGFLDAAVSAMKG